MSEILPVMGRRGQGYRNCKVAINTLVQQLCREEKVELWVSIVGRAGVYIRDGLHLRGKGAAMFADELSAAVDCGMGSIQHSIVSTRSTWDYLKVFQTGQESTSTHKPVIKCREIFLSWL